MILNELNQDQTIKVPDHIKGLIFDMDGTLVNSIPVHYNAWIEACSKYKASFSYDYFVSLTGQPVLELSKGIITKFGLKVSAAQLVDEKEQLVEKNLNKVELIQPVMRVIRAHDGKLPMAVGTGASKKMATRLLSETGIIHQFQTIVTSDDVDRYKPHPDTFLKAAQEINVLPQDCLVFEDGQLGIEAALAAGMTVVDVKPFYE